MIGNVSIDRVLCYLGSSVSLMPHSIFKRLGLEELRLTSIFLQLADCSIKYHLAILEDVPIKVGDFYVPIDFVILGIVKDSRTQIILGRPFLATAWCKIDVKEGKLAFYVGGHHTEFSLFEDFESSPSTFSCRGCEVVVYNEPMSMLDMISNDPSNFNCTLFEGSGLDGVTVDSLPPSIIEDKPCAVDEGYLSGLCRFVTLMMSMPPVEGVEYDVDVDINVEFEGGPSDDAYPRIIVIMDLALWKYFRLKKDLNPESLRWFLLIQQFNFEVRNKG